MPNPQIPAGTTKTIPSTVNTPSLSGPPGYSDWSVITSPGSVTVATSENPGGWGVDGPVCDPGGSSPSASTLTVTVPSNQVLPRTYNAVKTDIVRDFPFPNGCRNEGLFDVIVASGDPPPGPGPEPCP